MHPALKFLLAVVALLLLLPSLALALGYFLVVRPAFPRVDGDLRVAGLSAPVTIYRDDNGIPYILAQTPEDLFFAQGFVHAQDRLWAMESARRAAHGTLSEVIGERGLNNDRFMRTLGMTQAAQADWEALDEETQAMLQAYADGVNAFLAQAGNKLPLEFRILGFQPEAWTPIDSLVFAKLVAWGLSNNYEHELIVAQLAEVISWDKVLSILPDYPGPDVIPDANRVAGLPEAARGLLDLHRDVSDLAGFVRPDQGSNAWVVGGSHTASGQPLLANDPHQGLSMPSLWYEMGLRTVDERYTVVGGSLPGLSGIQIGHNGYIAWGVTNARPDVQDLFVETLNEDGTRYLFMGEWRELSLREEVIPVKGQEPVTLTVRSTHHGPLVSDVLPNSPTHLALRWTGTDQARPLPRAVLALDRARNWEEFRAALRDWQVPGLHFVYADAAGNIGYQMSGAVPIRAGNDVFGLRPVPGAEGQYEWVDFIPFEEMPSAHNPTGDFFASANNRPVGPEYPYFLSHYFQPPYRAIRISDFLRGGQNLTVDDFAALQADRYSALNHQVARTLVAEITPGDAVEEQALALLADWDGEMAADSGGAALSEVAMWHILRQTLLPELGPELTEDYLSLAAYPYMFLQHLLDEPDNPWWRGDRAGVLHAAWQASLAELGQALGSNPSEWRWGALHPMVFEHPLGSVAPLRPIFNRGPYPAGGNWSTINSGGYYWEKRYTMGLGPAYRIISDPADWNRSVSILPTGQSGQPFTRHYADQIRPWLAVTYHPLPFTPEAIRAAAAHTLNLVPGP